ncbi:hypothetical protein GCM10028816_12700 [Spirosoma lituiforme]
MVWWATHPDHLNVSHLQSHPGCRKFRSRDRFVRALYVFGYDEEDVQAMSTTDFTQPHMIRIHDARRTKELNDILMIDEVKKQNNPPE